MIPGGGKKKGSEFERCIAKAIVKAFKSFGVEQRDCWRSVLSGGHFMSSGDLEMTIKMETLFPFSVDCKARKKIHWENFLLENMKSEEMKWVEQVLEGVAKRPKLLPLLVLKENNCKIVAISQSVLGPAPLHLCGKNWIVEPWTGFLEDAVLEANHRKRNGT